MLHIRQTIQSQHVPFKLTKVCFTLNKPFNHNTFLYVAYHFIQLIVYNTEVLLDASKGDGVEVNTEETK
jgi:hypothetical protein